MSLKQQNTMKIQCDWVNDFTVVNFKSGHSRYDPSHHAVHHIIENTDIQVQQGTDMGSTGNKSRRVIYKLTMARLTIIKKSEQLVIVMKDLLKEITV